VTFDDGQKDNLEHAAPLLAEFAVPATFFATAAHIESGEPIWHDRLSLAFQLAQARAPEGVSTLMASLPTAPNARNPLGGLLTFVKTLPPSRLQALVERVEHLAGGMARHRWDAMMTWDDLAELARAGHEIASHTLSHPILPNCSAEEIEEEVVDSKRRIEQRLGLPITSFAYPNGDYDARTLAAVRRAGYRRAVTTGGGTNRPGAPPLELRRCDVVAAHARDRHGALSGPCLAWRLTDLRPGLR
jgi:peptidoglycan/xylan/chitin deacetylase (PgdA/CDA1 family)